MRADEVRRRQKKLVEEHQPTYLQVKRRDEALDAYLDHQDFGLPYGGGSAEQPYQWKRAMRFALRCERDARWEVAQIEAQEAAAAAEGQ